jgi:hypothetical protein
VNKNDRNNDSGHSEVRASKVSPVEGLVKGNEPEGVKSFQRPKLVKEIVV